MKRTMVKGERKFILTKDPKGKDIPRTGKNGGPCIQQEVVLVLDPNK